MYIFIIWPLDNVLFAVTSHWSLFTPINVHKIRQDEPKCNHICPSPKPNNRNTFPCPNCARLGGDSMFRFDRYVEIQRLDSNFQIFKRSSLVSQFFGFFGIF